MGGRDLPGLISLVQSPEGSEVAGTTIEHWSWGGGVESDLGVWVVAPVEVELEAEARATVVEVGEVARADHTGCGCVLVKLYGF